MSPPGDAAVAPARAWRGRVVAWLLVALVLATSLAIARFPDEPARPVLPPGEGIVTSAGFAQTTGPTDYEVRDSIRNAPGFRTWRSWTPARGASPGEARSAPFRLPPHLAVPYQGFAGDEGIRLYVECLPNGRQLDVADARTNNQWSEAIVSRPSGWCPGLSRLVAHTDSHWRFLSFGTPYRVSTLAWLKTRWIGLLAPWALVFALLAGLCVGGTVLARRARPGVDALAPGLLAMGVAGYATFFVFDASHRAGVAWCIALGIGGALAWMALAARGRLRAASPWRVSLDSSFADWRLPLVAWAAVSLAYLAVLFAGDNGAGAWLANGRFAPVRWSTDNQLPMLAGEYLAQLRVRDLDLRPWQLSDRTPLSYGLHALMRRWSLLLLSREDGYATTAGMHTAIGIVLNTAWAPVLAHVGRRLGLSRARLAWLLAGAATLPFCLFNSVYIWPKLLGGAFGLLALWLLVIDPEARGERPAAQAGRWMLAAALAAFALLSHGGTVFGIVAMLALAPLARGVPNWRALVAGGATAGLVLAPWVAWGRVVQPRGTALLKSVFGGTFGFDERDMGVWATIHRSYAALAPGQWWQMKLEAMRSLLLPATPQTCSYGEMVAGTTGVAAWRISDFASLAPSVKFLWLGLVPLAVALLRRRMTPVAHAAGWLLAAGLLAVAIDAVVAWDCQIIHTQSYQSVLAIVAGLLLALCCLAPRALGHAAIASSIAYGIAVWIVHPLLQALRVDPLAIGALAFGAIALLAWAWRERALAPGAPA